MRSMYCDAKNGQKMSEKLTPDKFVWKNIHNI